MSLDQQWRDFVCDPARPGRYLSGIGRKVDADVAQAVDPIVLDNFLEKLAGTGASVDLLAEAVDLAYGGYADFCSIHLRSLLDALANERVGENAVVGPSLLGRPRWDRTVLARRTARIPRTHYISRLPERSFALPENSLVRWLVGSLAQGIDFIERRIGPRALPQQLLNVRTACAESLSHQWFSQVEAPASVSTLMISAAARQRHHGYRVAAGLAARRAPRQTGDRTARWLRTLDLLRVNWLSPNRIDDLFELYALTLVLDVLEVELGLGSPTEYGLVVPGRNYVAQFNGKSAGEILVFFDQSPQTVLQAQSRYKKILDAHVPELGSARRPDVMVVRRTPDKAEIVTLIEVKDTRDAGYTADSVYKAMGYIYDFQGLWKVGPPCPKVILLLPDDFALHPDANLATLDVVLVSSLDRMMLARSLATRLDLPLMVPPASM